MNASLRDRVTRGCNALWYGGNRLYWLLWPISLLVRALVALRRWAYARGWLESIDVGVPVVVIGNLTTGGTGKTPLTIWLARELSARGFRAGIICRGYRGGAETWPQRVDLSSDALAVGDEAALLALKSGCPVVAGPDRVAAANELLKAGQVDFVLADDGLQHYRLQRCFEIAVIDGRRRLGNRLCLPAGPLREPEARLRTVDAIVVNAGDPHERDVYRASLRVVQLMNLTSKVVRPLAEFSGLAVHAVAAIGNPDRYFGLLADAGLVVHPHAHADHAVLGASDLRFGDGLPVLITEKDAVKCQHMDSDHIWTVMAELQFAPGDGERLLDEIDRRLRAAGDRR